MSIEIEKPVKNDLEGFISVKFRDSRTFDEFCARYISNFEVNRFEPLAIRFFLGKESIVTIYAVDKSKAAGGETDSLPVKKFKVETIPMNEVLSFIEECNFTLTTGKYPLEDMEVQNK